MLTLKQAFFDKKNNIAFLCLNIDVCFIKLTKYLKYYIVLLREVSPT